MHDVFFNAFCLYDVDVDLSLCRCVVKRLYIALKNHTSAVMSATYQL